MASIPIIGIVLIMYHCIKKCGRRIGRTAYWTEPKESCPFCGARVVEERGKRKTDWANNKKKVYFHDRWPKRNHVMDVGIDRIHCPTRQSYLDACKNARVMRPGVGGYERTDINPAGVKD